MQEGKGSLRIGKHRGEDGAFYRRYRQVTKLVDTAFSTIPGAPAFVSKAEYYRAKEPRLGFDLDLRGHNAIEGEFTFVAQG
jgi:hypothetical protein